MDAVSVPFLPAGLWLLATASSILIVLIIFGMHIYQRRRFERALIDSRGVAELATRKEQLQADVTELRTWISSQTAELARLTTEREEQERLRGELSRLQNECATEDQRLSEFRKEAGALENQRYILTQAVDKLTADVENLKSQSQTLEDLQSQITGAQAELEAAKREINAARDEADSLLRQTAERRIELGVIQDRHDKLADKFKADQEEAIRLTNILTTNKDELQTIREIREQLERESRALKAEIEGYRENLSRRDALLKEINILEDQKAQCQGVGEQLEKARILVEEKRSELAAVRQEADFLTRQTADRRIELEASQIHHTRLSETLQKLTEECAQLSEKNRHLSAEKEKVQAELGKLEGDLCKLHEIEREVRRLEHEENDLKDKIGKLNDEIGKSSGHSSEGDNPYADLLKAPSCLVKSHHPSKNFPHIDEDQALNEVRIQLENAGYHFHKRVVTAFHTALKCHDINPLTVLAGVSGTGKTILPVAYARLMGMHSLVIAVQPRWDSPQDMFGFYNYLEKKYKATDLARALIRMDRCSTVAGLNEQERRADRMLLVLLDEMNLARTEYYFSEFLSKLELRRLSGTSANASDSEHSKIQLDTVPGLDPISFWVGNNVLFAGTMNEDETTQTLSDKVLDRANVLRFGRPAKRNSTKAQTAQIGNLPDPLGYLSTSQWMEWCESSAIQASWNTKAQGWIDDLNDALTKVGRPFGHRVSQSIMAYVANYPGVTINDTYKDAFADQIEQKILPKLRGLDTMEGNTVFDGVGRIIDKTGDETLGKAFAEATQDNATGMFLWQGVTRQD